MIPRSFSMIALAAVLMSTTIMMVTDPAIARERTRSATVTGSNGASGVATKTMSRDGMGQKSIQRSWNGDNGNTASSSTTRNVDRESGTATRNTNRVINGNTSTYMQTGIKNPDGTYTITGSGTTANGQSISRQGTVVKTDDGYTSNGTYTNRNGETGTYGSTRTRTETGYTKTQTATTPNGETRQRSVTGTRSGDGSYQKSITNNAGNTRNWGATLNR